MARSWLVQVNEKLLFMSMSMKTFPYRFADFHGIPEYSPGDEHCRTNAPGWLNGTHPSEVGVSKTADVCFVHEDDDCRWSVSVKVMKCSDYYLYYLPNTPRCSLRYCGASTITKGGKKDTTLFLLRSK